MKKTLYFISLFSLLLLSACGSEDNPAGSRTVKAVAVSALQIDAQPVAGTSSYSGTVEALEEVQLSTRISGWVEKVYVSEGQPVQKGQTLVKLRSDDLEAKRSQAEASIAEADVYYQNAATNLKRIEALFKNGAATRKELDDMQSAFASAEARRRTAYEAKKEVEAILSYSILKAPFDGVVTAKFADEGDLANLGQTIVEVENLRQLKITAKVPETEVGSLTTGMPVLIQVSASAAAGAPLKGTIDQIVPSADPLSRQFDIKVLIKEPGQLLKPGMFARVSIAGKADRTLLIPREAVFLRGQLEGIYVVDDQNIARLRWIRSGSTFGTRVEVLSGLNPGEKIITAGMANLLDGQPVEVQP